MFFYRPTGRPKRTSLQLECHQQRNQSESFPFKCAAFYQGLKSKGGLAAAKAAALRINLNVQGCSIVEEEEEEDDLFVFNDTIEGSRAPVVKPGRRTQA